MNMEDIKSAVNVMTRKPPTEPPPLLEKTSKEEAQYIDNAKPVASTSLKHTVMAKVATMKNVSYSPNIEKYERSRDTKISPTKEHTTQHGSKDSMHVPD